MNKQLMRPLTPGQRTRSQCQAWLTSLLALWLTLAPLTTLAATAGQDPVTGAFEGTVSDSRTGQPIAGAAVQFVNVLTEVPVAKRSDSAGRFYQGLLQPGTYRIRVTAPGYQTQVVEQRLLATRGNTVVPLPVKLDPVAAQPAPDPNKPADPQPTTTTQPTPTPVIGSAQTAELNVTDGRRGGAYTDREVETLPLGDTTFTRTFDNFALFIPGLALPPQTQGRVAGPGVGAGVGSAGQFSANGIRSRANNFLVDGSDNNDEDIGVRRQGFFMLVPQPVESIKEYQIISNLAPAQFGRNIGAQVNAISKSGGYETHGTVYGFLNTSDLNARDFFDTKSNGAAQPLQALVNGTARPVAINGTPVTVRNPAAGKDSQTFGNAGLTLGGPLLPRPKTDADGNATGSGKSAFYFLSLEGAILNANKEQHFAVPTVEERGFAQTGATGLIDSVGETGYPTSAQGDAVFSLYPFANNPNGIYGRNTYTQILPASAQGYSASLKLDHSFKAWGRDQSVTGRYNRTHDWRNIPATGGGLYATLRPVVGTQNFSFFWNGELTHSGATTPIYNQFRASYGRTRLNFEEERDRQNLLDPQIVSGLSFAINAPLLENYTLPGDNFVDYRRRGFTTELGYPVDGGLGSSEGGALGTVGQILMPGFSPLGVDVNNFPQRRVNNTYQFADILSFRKSQHSVALGFDYRRVHLNSDLPRNSRPQLVFGGAPILRVDNNGAFYLDGFFRPDSLAAAQAASGFFQTLVNGTSNIGLRYSQYNGFAQDEWRLRPNLSLSVGLRYEYNSPPNEVNNLIEKTFSDPALNLSAVNGLTSYIGGRRNIFEPDRNNFAPRAGLAWAKNWAPNWQMVIRGGYGLYFDQVIGAVVSQSRNVFPTALTINTGGGLGGASNAFEPFDLFNPSLSLGGANFSNGIEFNGRFEPFVRRGTLNSYNTNLPLDVLVNTLSREFPGGFGFTLPARGLRTPKAHQYSLTIEQQLGSDWVFSASYVGSNGRRLLRLTTPNLGPNLNLISSPFLLEVDPETGIPTIPGFVLPPGTTIARSQDLQFVGLGGRRAGRPIPNAGAIFLYDTISQSNYDSLQLQLRGRLTNSFQFQAGYTLSKALDNASDVFDLAGAPALPQNSLRPSEYGLANFDTRHRFGYNFIWTLPTLAEAGDVVRTLFGGYEIAGTGQFQTGQPFTVNSINDVNLDGNFTDRLNSYNGLVFNTGDRRIPVRLANNASFSALQAPIGSDGAVGRNTFTASNYLLLNLAVIKNFNFTDTQRLTFRAEAFNFLNRANFAIPVRYLEAPTFGESVDTVTPPRRFQFALKYSF